MSGEDTNRVVLIGLDGGTFSILDPLMAEGEMPFLKDFVGRGVRGILLSTPHPLTPPAWTSLMTGHSPGNHGVFDFVRVERRDDHLGYVLTTSADVRRETVWSIASRQGCRVTSLNFPCMFPPPQINGFVVPGFVPWSFLPRAVHPRDLYPRLKAQPEFNSRELALDWDVERKALQGLPEEDFETWVRFHTAREQQWFEITRFLMREEPCDLTAVLFDGVDKLQHLCYHLLDPRFAPLNTSERSRRVRELCLEYFRQLDGFIKAIVEMSGPQAQVFLASDHGFTSAGDKIFYANVWLQQRGHLEWVEGVPMDEEGRLTVEGHTGSNAMFDWGATNAFALTASSNGIFIRRAARPGALGVSDEEYPAFRQSLITALLEFTDPATGETVVEKVLTREEAFAGSYVDQAPDLTLVLRNRSFISVLRADSALKQRRSPYGTHHPHGIFIAGGPGIRAGVEIPPLSIINVSPTLLYSLGLPAPADMEGEAALSIFEPWFIDARRAGAGQVSTDQDGPRREAPAEILPSDEEARIMEQLKALGYLE